MSHVSLLRYDREAGSGGTGDLIGKYGLHMYM